MKCPGRLVVHCDDTHTCPVCRVEGREPDEAEHRALTTCARCPGTPEHFAETA